MKKLHLLIALSLCALTAMAQNGRIDLRHESKSEIVKSDFSSLRATFSYGSIESIEVPTERGSFSEIAIEGTYAAGEIGSPELPATHQLLAVPFGATPRVSVTHFTTTDYRLSDYGINTLVPRQASVRKDQKPEDIEFAYNASAYQTRSLATAPEASIEVQGTMRGIQIGSLVINPVSYNPATNTLRVFNNIEVEVSFDGADLQETERMLMSTCSPYFDIIYKQMFNYRAIQSVYDDHPDLMAYPVHMIVVAPQNYVSTLQPWINWKVQKGFDVNVVTKEQAGFTYSAIRSYIQNLYNTGVSQGKTPTFLVLVGDVAQIPNTTGSSSQKVTDLYYGTVDSDYFPDMFYSRMSAENTTQLTNIVNKILQYEQYTMSDPSYLNKVLLIAGQDSYWNPRVGQPTINYAINYYYNAAHGFTDVYAYLNTYTNCYNNLNTGVGFANYTAHGSETSWAGPSFTNSNVNNLTNANKYFLAMGNCCLSGNFGYGTACFGETMIRAANKGAYSYIGSCPNTYWYEDYYFGVGATNTFSQMPTQAGSATGVYDGVWMDDTYNTVSSMTFLGNIAVCYAHAGSYTTSVTPTYYWQAYHVLGDGSIMPYRVNPTANVVNHATTIAANATSFTVTAQAGSYVGISQNNVLKGAALVPTSGTVNVPVSGITSGQQVRIVVTKPQRQPYIQDINVSGGGTTTYTITATANPTAGGTVSGGGTYNQGQSCTLTATPATGYTFVKWTKNGTQVSTNASYTFTVTASGAYVAHFQQQSYTITATANPTDGGTVAGGGSYNHGQSCTLEATANEGYTFVKWTKNGTQVSTNASYTFTVTASGAYVAHFQQQSYTITATANPTDGGTVAGGGSYNHGQSCTLEATANEGYTFVKWTKNGTQVSTDPTYTFNVTASASYVAHFQQQSYTITATVNPEEGGTVTGDGTYAYGASCTLEATPNEGFEFVKWTKDGVMVSDEPDYTFDVTESADYEAIFQIITYTITATANPAQGGTVTGDGTYEYGETCSLEAEPNTGYNFLRWTKNGTQVSTNPCLSFTVTESASYVAVFQLQSFTITASANPSNGGEIDGDGIYNYGENCILEATPNEGFVFEKWTRNGELGPTTPLCAFTVTESAVYVAHFLERFTITLTANPTEGGHVEGDTYGTYGQVVVARAIPNAGYYFVNWTENGEVVSTDDYYIYTITNHRNLVANFNKITYTLTATADPAESATIVGVGTYGWQEEVTVTAIPNEDWAFQNWTTESGIVVSEELSYTFTIEHNFTLIAHFIHTESIGENGVPVKVYPNPTKGEVTVSSEGLSHIRIMNAYGQTVYNAKMDSDQVRIDLSDMAKGVYMMHIETNGGQTVRKIVVE